MNNSIAQLLLKGYEVYIPLQISSKSRTIILEIAGKLLKVEIKKASEDRHGCVLRTDTINNTIDGLVIVHRSKVWYIPVEDLTNKGSSVRLGRQYDYYLLTENVIIHTKNTREKKRLKKKLSKVTLNKQPSVEDDNKLLDLLKGSSNVP